MMGLPEATHQDMENIVRFAKRLNPTYALFHLAAPYPGTELYERVENDPELRFSDESLFPEAVEGRFTLPELKAIVRNAHMSYYLRPSYVFTRLQKGDLQSLVKQVRLFRAYVNSE
jgi:radical SAM superfamily enzyme YgiQ (UPF0313 family)